MIVYGLCLYDCQACTYHRTSAMLRTSPLFVILTMLMVALQEDGRPDEVQGPAPSSFIHRLRGKRMPSGWHPRGR